MIFSYRFSILSLLLGVVLVACSDTPATQPPTVIPEDTTSVPVTLAVENVAGGVPLALQFETLSASGASFKVTRFRFYLSQPALIGPTGDTIPVTLLDSAGQALPYNILLVDITRPATQTIRFLARKKSYRGMLLSLGVPIADATGDTLNHGDASLRTYPLDVDADMYWSWNPGYIFLKLDGQVQRSSGWSGFSYHVGGDANFRRIPLPDSLVVGSQGASRRLVVDVNRLFVTPAGAYSPDITTGSHVSGGPMAAAMATNAAGSGFLTLRK